MNSSATRTRNGTPIISPSAHGRSSAIPISSEAKSPVSRISVSLPEELVRALDDMVVERGFASRSQAVGDMLHQAVADHRADSGDEVMVGIVTLFYDNSVPELQKQLADLQFRHIDEVISSLHVHLARNQTMEVVLVQGPAATLRRIADAMITRRGVLSGKIQLMAAVIPPVHPLL